MKASAIDRDLSFKALTDRLGAYEPPGTQARDPIMRYSGMPRGAEPGLWERYQQERQRALEARAAAQAALRAAHLRYGQDLNAWYRQRYANAKAQHLSRADRLSTQRTLDASRKSDHARRKAREIEDRRRLKEKHAVPTWEGFLARAAGVGDRVAQVALERRIDARIEDRKASRDAEHARLRTDAERAPERDGGRC